MATHGIEGQQVDLHALLSQELSITEVGEGLTNDEKHVALQRMQLDDLITEKDLSLTATFMLDKIANMTDDEALSILKDVLVKNNDDSNFPDEEYQLAFNLVQYKDPSFEVSRFDPNESLLTFIKNKFSSSSDDKGIVSYNHKDDLKQTRISEKKTLDDFSEIKNFSSSENKLREVESNISSYYSEIFDWSLQARIEASLVQYWSPYPEVRSATVPFDDPNQLCETWRAYVAGLIWVAITSFINQYFAQRFPSIGLGSSAAQLFLYPTGTILSLLPNFDLKIRGYTFQLNPGPWSFKEQMLASMMVTISGTPYIEGPIYAQRMNVFYGEKWITWGYQILLGISTQFIGFGLAGLVRKFCIYPAKSVWPTILPTVVLNRTLTVPEKKENIHGWTLSRYAYFFIVFSGSFLWYWVPGYLFQALSTFSWITWIKPYNFNLDVITGFNEGLGVNPITSFDWNYIGTYSPLVVPAFNNINSGIGLLIGLVSIIGLYYTNYSWSSYLPVNSSAIFDNTGERYKIGKILNEDQVFDNDKYQKYSPPFYTAANLVSYGAFFASYPFVFLFTCFTNWNDILFASKSLWLSLRQFHRSSLEGFNDPHSRMMRQYKEVPEWVFLIVLLISLVLGIVVVEVYPTETPVWGLFFVVAINFVFLIPITVLCSITGYQLSMNVLVELIIGYALPGKPNAHLILKSFGTQTDIQAENYISNQKIGHYSKIPPWAAFRVQILGTFVSLFICLGVINWQIDSFEGLCEPHQPQKFTCKGDAQIYFSASVIWGVIGPKRIFDGLYPMLKYCFLIGFLLAFPCYLIRSLLSKKHRKWFQPAIIISGVMGFAPSNVSYFIMSFYFCLIFMVYIKNRYLDWWTKYNYLTSVGLGSGLAISSIIIFFAVEYHDKSLDWWGNNIVYKGIEGGNGQTSRFNASLADGGYFGPRLGNFP